MTLKESQQVKPMHLKIVTAAPDDTVEKLAHRMATSRSLTRALPRAQRLSAADRIKPGDKVEDRRGVTAASRNAQLSPTSELIVNSRGTSGPQR